MGVILACVLVFGFLYANNDIGKTANSLEADIRQSQKILDDWIVDGSISDTMAAFISYPQDKTDHTFSVYVNRPGLSFGYFFRGGGDIVEVDDYIAEFVVEGNNERAFISMNTQNIVRLEVDDGNGIQVIDIDSGKPFAIVLPLNVGNICFYDTTGNGNVKKCAVGKYPKSEKHGNTAQFSEVERSGTQENCGGIGSSCRLRLRPLPVLRRRQSQRVARIDPNAVVVGKNIAENDRFDLFSRQLVRRDLVDLLFLERGKKALHPCVVEAMSGAAEALYHAAARQLGTKS